MNYEDKKEEEIPGLSLVLHLETEYSEKTGLLRVFDLSMVRQRTNFKFKQYGLNRDGGQFSVAIDAPGAASWPSGTLVHLLFRFEKHPGVCTFATGYLDKNEAERAFQEAESGMWQSIVGRRLSCPGKAFCVVKVNQWHCDLLECVITERGGWRRPIQGADTWFLRSVVLE